VVATVFRSLVEIGAAVKGFFERAILRRLEIVLTVPRWKRKLSPLPKFPLTRKSKRVLGMAWSPAMNSTSKKSIADGT
jgi:hypothetical protein